MVHILYSDKELSNEQCTHICLILGAQKCIKDTELKTYSFHEETTDNPVK